MPYVKKIIRSGDVYEVEVFFSPRTPKSLGGVKIPRADNKNLTTEQQAELNLKQARKKLSRRINANFFKGDIFCTLTYRGDQPNYETAIGYLQKFLRKLGALRKKRGMAELKYIAVTEGAEESSDHRIHHHLLLNYMPMEDIGDLWPHGRKIISRLEPGGDYTGIAHYITKEPRKEHKKRWSQSRNLRKPEVLMVIAKRNDKLPVPKGYREVMREQFYSEVTGSMQYLKCIRVGGEDYSEGRSG